MWAELIDSTDDDLSSSISISSGVHKGWIAILSSSTFAELDRSYYHPESKSIVTIKEAVATYDWHCRHHLAHINLALESKEKYQ